MDEKEFLEMSAALDQRENDQEPEQEHVQDDVQEQEYDEVEQQEEQEQDDPTADLSPVEKKAYEQGWRPQEDFTGDPAEWKTAAHFISDGKWMTELAKHKKEMDDMKASFDKRLANQNKYHEMQRQNELNKLKAKQREAVDNADTDAYDTAQRQIDELNNQKFEEDKPEQSQQYTPGAAATAFQQDNPWLSNPDDHRTLLVTGVLQNIAKNNPEMPEEEVVNVLKEKLKVFDPKPQANPRRQQPAANESGRRPNKAPSRSLTMDDLTMEEREQYKNFGHMFGTEKDFLQAVKDSRGNQ